MLRVLRRLAAGRARIATRTGSRTSWPARAAFVSQKCTLDYCRARAGIGWAQLFREDEFGRALERCRWEAYAAVLADVGEVALIYLRHCGGDGPQSRPGWPRPCARPWTATRSPGIGPDWDDAVEAAQARLHRALLAPPRPVHRIGRRSGGKVFEVLPIHTNLKAHDREMVVNNVRFLLCRVYADMERELDGPALVRAAHDAAAPDLADRHQRRDEGGRGAQAHPDRHRARASRSGSSPRPAPPPPAMPICRKPPRPEAVPAACGSTLTNAAWRVGHAPRLARRRRGWSAGTGPRATSQPASSSAEQQQRAGQRAQAAQQDHAVAADPAPCSAPRRSCRP